MSYVYRPIGNGWLEFAGLENDRPSKNGGGVEFAGLENDGVEQEQTYILHTMKNFNVYHVRHVIVSSTNLKTYIIPHLELYLSKYDKQKKSYNDHSTSCVPVL